MRVHSGENEDLKEFSSKEMKQSLKMNIDIKDDHSIDSIKKVNGQNDTDSINDEVMDYLQNLNNKTKFSNFDKTQRKIRDINSRFQSILKRSPTERAPLESN